MLATVTSPTCRRCGQQFCRSIMLECCTANCTARLASVAPGRERGVRRALSTPWSPSLDAVATTLYMESCERFHVRCERACGERACGTLCQERTILHAARALSCARPVPPDARRRASRKIDRALVPLHVRLRIAEVVVRRESRLHRLHECLHACERRARVGLRDELVEHLRRRVVE